MNSESERLFLKAEMLLDECIELRATGSNADQGRADMFMAQAFEIRASLENFTTPTTQENEY